MPTYFREETEKHIQKHLVLWVLMKYPDLLFTISPAGVTRGNSRQRIISGREAKEMGYCRGTSDLFFIKRSGKFSGLFLELKKEGGRVSPDQQEFMRKAEAEGFCCLVAYGYEDALKKVKGYLDANA